MVGILEEKEEQETDLARVPSLIAHMAKLKPKLTAETNTVKKLLV